MIDLVNYSPDNSAVAAMQSDLSAFSKYVAEIDSDKQDPLAKSVNFERTPGGRMRMARQLLASRLLQ